MRVRIAVDAPQHSGISEPLDYHCERLLLPGTLVQVPLGKRQVTGVVWPSDAEAELHALVDRPPVRLKTFPIHVSKVPQMPGHDAAGEGRAVLVLDQPLSDLLWSFAPSDDRPAPESTADVPAVTPESTAMAKTMRGKGFRFIGPTTAYALMQATGMVDDHLAGCAFRPSPGVVSGL